MGKIGKTIAFVLSLAIALLSCSEKPARVKTKGSIYQKELENNTWITDKILGLNPNVETYKLTKFVERKFAGNLTNFNEKSGFNSRYTSFCGNDYFTTLHGKYEFFDKDKLSIVVDTISYHGEWKKPTEYRKPEELVFTISKQGDVFLLTKYKD